MYSYLYDQKWGSMLRISEHLYLSCSERYCSASTLCTDTWTVHISLGKHQIEQPCKIADIYIFQMINHIWGRRIIGKHLDVLPNVLYYHKDQPLTICPSRTAWLRLWISFSATNIILVYQASSRQLTISRLLGGSPNKDIQNFLFVYFMSEYFNIYPTDITFI